MSTHLDLLIGCNGTEYHLRETLCWKHTETNTTDHIVILDESHTLVFPEKEREKYKSLYWEQMLSHIMCGGEEHWTMIHGLTDQTLVL